MPTGIAVERGNTYQTVNTAFCLQQSICKIAVKLESTGFDTRTIAVLPVQFGYVPTLFLAVHAVHLVPVSRPSPGFRYRPRPS